jgi:hypothetical protein
MFIYLFFFVHFQIFKKMCWVEVNCLFKFMSVIGEKIPAVSHYVSPLDLIDYSEKNSIFNFNPPVLYFRISQLNATISQKLTLVNHSDEAVKYEILPPVTQFFNISFKKKEFLSPGIGNTITVTFTPTEFRYYTDEIRVISPNNVYICICLINYFFFF